jgi:hypothetical protein
MRADFESFHDGKGRAIGKAEAYVLILLKDSPCGGDIIDRHVDYVDGRGIKKLLAGTKGGQISCVDKVLTLQVRSISGSFPGDILGNTIHIPKNMSRIRAVKASRPRNPSYLICK